MVEVEFIEGFDVPSSGNVVTKYAPYTPTNGGYSFFLQSQMVAGRFAPGNAMRLDNTAFGEAIWPKTLTSRRKRAVGIAIRPLLNAYGNPVLLYRFQVGTVNTQIAIRLMPDRTIQITKGGAGGGGPFDGAVVGTIGTALPLNQWSYLLVGVNFHTTGEVRGRIYRPDGTVQEQAFSLSTLAFPGLCDTVALRWAAFGQGIDFDDYYVAGGDAADTMTDLLDFGACRVITAQPSADYLAQWTPHPAGSHAARVNERNIVPGIDARPDGDLSYIQAPTGAAQDLFVLEETACVGRILAVALNASFKPSTPGQGIRLICVQPPNERTLGTLFPVRTGYEIAQAVSNENPDSADFWSEADVNAAAWGVYAMDGGSRVSNIFLEKLVSLDTTLPFECGGGGNYAY